MELNPLSILLHAINLLILMVAYRFFLYNPVTKFMQKRMSKFEQERQEVAKLQEEADVLKKDWEDRIEHAHVEVELILQEGRENSQRQDAAIMENAQGKVTQLMESAQIEANGILQLAREQARNDTVALAVKLASRVLEREVKNEDHQELLEELLEVT